MSKTRIYVVHDADLDQASLVRAISASQAITHVTKPRFSASVASQDQLVKLLGEGVEVKDASVQA